MKRLTVFSMAGTFAYKVEDGSEDSLNPQVSPEGVLTVWRVDAVAGSAQLAQFYSNWIWVNPDELPAGQQS